jgi:hypothetical protein
MRSAALLEAAGVRSRLTNINFLELWSGRQ